MQFRTERFQAVEVVVGANGTMPGANSRVPFKDQPQLQTYSGGQQVWLNKIEAYSDGSLSFSPISTGIRIATPTLLQGLTLTLVSRGIEILNQVPLADLVTTQTPAANANSFSWQGFLLRNFYTVDWAKSYITTVVSLAGENPFSVLFGVHYSYQPLAYVDDPTIVSRMTV